MKMIDQGQEDDKIIAIHVDDPEFSHYTDIDQLPEHCLKMLRRFFEDYKVLENKEVRIDRFLGAADAFETISKAFDLYESQKKTLTGYNECCLCTK